MFGYHLALFPNQKIVLSKTLGKADLIEAGLLKPVSLKTQGFLLK
ncbi:hypothetical protein EW15_1640 [Prochlorococcus sp. MIT 0801]|nr:hypothetical protein EW15_1640 [Prochlorococcus sp. MIT 0801]